MASSPNYYNLIFTAILPCKKESRLIFHHQSFRVRAQSYKDQEGRSRNDNNIVDAKLRILRERIEEVRNKERLERCCVAKSGWNFEPLYDLKRKRDEEMVLQFYQIVGNIFGTFGLTILTCTFCLFIFSLLININ
ncbi:hypothetical protein ACJIZ3_014556 [Penstemon smallii]|uniref:Uncharacterized protein n=1 Tax=Penstemon smallii TaxID=265156 RepID=A0ABD3RK08_9LAMI